MWMPASMRWLCPTVWNRLRLPRPRRLIGKAARSERRKALAATLNALSVAPIVTAVLQPATTGKAVEVIGAIVAALVFIATQAALSYILGTIED